MPKIARRRFLLMTSMAVSAPMLLGAAGPAQASEARVFTRRGLAIRGYDPVAYFTTGAPAKGDSANTTMWDGAEWRFATAANKALFDADPQAYAPQYGGYCAFAVANNYTASTDPDAWSIENGKLYLNYSRSVRARWLEDVPGNIAKGDANWPSVLD